MTMVFAKPVRTVGDLIRRWNARGDFLLATYAIVAAAMLLTNNLNLAPKLFLLLIPAAILTAGGLKFEARLPHFRVSLAGATITLSIIFIAILVYLLALNISASLQPNLNTRLADQQWLFAGQILLFVFITAHAVARIDGFLIRLLGFLIPLVAVSALLNVWVFIATLPPGASLYLRLTNWLGMPGYTNSTNISVTYALFFVAALSIIVSPRRNALLRWWLAPAAIILLVAVLLTQARSALIGTALGGMTALVLARGRIFWRKHGWKVAAMLLIAAALALSNSTLRSIASARGESLRPTIWAIYATKALQAPLVGAGGLANIDIVLPDGTVIDQPHNIVLSSQVRGGLFAMVAMLVVLLGSLYWSARYWMLTRNAIPLAMIVTVAATSMFDYNLLITAPTWPWITFWLPFAICAGAEIAVRSAQSQPFETNGRA